MIVPEYNGRSLRLTVHRDCLSRAVIHVRYRSCLLRVITTIRLRWLLIMMTVVI